MAKNNHIKMFEYIKAHKLRPCLVLWEDITVDGTWTDDTENAKTADCLTAGHFIGRDKKSLKVAMTYGEGEWGELMSQPSGVIKDVLYLDEFIPELKEKKK